MSVNYQQMAIETFTRLIERATAYRASGSQDTEKFSCRHGICDNIYLSMDPETRDRGGNHDKMLLVKDNLIRKVPSFSGAYHYPVKNPNPQPFQSAAAAAEDAWDSSSNKWEGDYGAERLIQAKELLDMVTNKWDDSFVKRMTPAQRVGIVDGVIVQHVDTGVYYTISSDDDTSDPYFREFGEDSGRTCISLSDLKIVKMDDIPKRSAASLINELNRRVKARKKIEAKLQALQDQIKQMKFDQAGVELALRQQHNVQLVNR